MKYLKYFSIILFVVILSCSRQSSYKLTISIFNYDGTIPANSKLELYNYEKCKSEPVSQKVGNTYKLDISKYGLYLLSLSGDKNEYCYLHLFSDGESNISVKAFLPLIIERKDFIPKYEKLSKFIFEDTSSIACKISRIYSDYVSAQEEFMDSAYYYKTHNINNGNYINKNSGIILTRLNEKLKKEKSGEVRDMLYITYLQSWIMLPSGLDSATCDRILNEVKPNSVFWSFGGELMNYAIWATKSKSDKFKSYVEEGIKTTKDPNVKAELLYGEISALNLQKKYDEMTFLIDKLKRECPNTYKASIAESEFLNTGIGKSVPEFSLISVDNPKIIFTRSNMLGKIYLMDFWSTGCAPCIAEMPELHKVYENYKGKGLQIISITGDKKEMVNSFRKKKWIMPWNNTVLTENSKSQELIKSFGVYSIPAVFLISRDGIILARNEELRGKNLEKTIKKYLD